MERSIPDEEAVQVKVCPLLGLPPMMLLAIFRVFAHGVGRSGLGDSLEEDGAPGNVDVGLAQGRGQFHLEASSTC